jgi:hypothetical protein
MTVHVYDVVHQVTQLQTDSTMTKEHPINPPPELVEEWAHLFVDHTDTEVFSAVAQWGADQELEACCHLLTQQGFDFVNDLRAARRPKPPSLKEQALIHFESFAATFETSGGDSDLIRRALEQLPDYTSEEL